MQGKASVKLTSMSSVFFPSCVDLHSSCLCRAPSRSTRASISYHIVSLSAPPNSNYSSPPLRMIPWSNRRRRASPDSSPGQHSPPVFESTSSTDEKEATLTFENVRGICPWGNLSYTPGKTVQSRISAVCWSCDVDNFLLIHHFVQMYICIVMNLVIYIHRLCKFMFMYVASRTQMP